MLGGASLDNSFVVLKMKCRLLYVVGQLRSGGSERQLFNLLQILDRERYQPAVAVWNFHEEDSYVKAIRELNVSLYPCSLSSSRVAKLALFYRIAKQLQPEVIHSYSFFMNFAAYYVARKIGAISIGSVRSDFIFDCSSAGPFLGRLSARWPRAQIYNSYSAVRNAQESKGLFVPHQIFVIRNGLDVKGFAGSFKPIPGEPIILGVGSLFPVKQWDRLLRAAAEIKQKGVEFKIQIAGDGPLRPVLEQQTEEIGIAQCVEFLGCREDIPALVSNARFLVHTANSEGCPNVIMEAMACGRPVVAMHAGDISSFVDDGKTGFVVQQGDHMMLVQRILELLQNYSLCVQMGTAARDRAEREFGIERLVKETLEVYRKVGWKDSTFVNGGR